MRSVLLVFIALLLFSFNDKRNHWYNTTVYRCKYQTTDGRLNGPYTSYYSNGQKKAQGKFNNNYRTGKWTLWNYRGQLVAERYYTNPFHITGLYPDTLAKHRSDYVLERDPNGLYKHLLYTQNLVLAANRSWRLISPMYNPALFEGNRLYLTMQQAAINKQVKAFANDSCKTLRNFSGIDTSAVRIVGFKTMEDWIIDTSRLVLEYYTIALCPVAVYQTTGDTIDLYWVNHQELRPYLAKETLTGKGFPEYVKNLDDLFFFHCFAGKVIKTQFFEDKTHPLQKYDPVNVELRTDLDIIDNEHNIWLSFYK